MPFPISLSGDIRLREVTVEQAIARLHDAIAEERPQRLQREGRSLRFKGGFFRLNSNWNILTPIQGAVDVGEAAEGGVNVRYVLRFTEFLLLVTLTIAALGIPLVATRLNLSLPQAMGLLLLFWLTWFGTYFVLTVWRWPRFVRACIERRRSDT